MILLEKNTKDIYIWYELINGFIPPEIEKSAAKGLNQPLPTSYLHENSYFIRTKAKFVDGKYYFSIYSAGIQNLFYRLYLEVDDPDTHIENGKFTGLMETKIIDKHKLDLITIGSICWSNKIKLILKRHYSDILSPLYDFFILSY